MVMVLRCDQRDVPQLGTHLAEDDVAFFNEFRGLQSSLLRWGRATDEYRVSISDHPFGAIDVRNLDVVDSLSELPTGTAPYILDYLPYMLPPPAGRQRPRCG